MIGSNLSHFRITAKLGEGGMGEVYRAEDTKLGREVAIKVLPEAVAEDADRLARFGREAQVLASLNHPHIAAIYSFEKGVVELEPGGGSPGSDIDEPSEVRRAQHHPRTAERGEASTVRAGSTVHFLVMELVEGPTLAERLDTGPVPLQEALQIGHQIAEALEAAHERNIIHRDLKPANIKITPEGSVKVLDFGLAKALEEGPGSAANASQSPTLSLAATQAGIILGTAAYMSPEQAAAKPVDRRADIWAFGVVLYEMLTSKRLFGGDTVSETLAAVIMKPVDLDTLPSRTPTRVRNLLERCLRKDPRSRLRDMGDARVSLEEILAGDDGVAATQPVERTAPTQSRRPLLLAVAILAVIAFGLLIDRFTDAPEALPRHVNSFEIQVSTGAPPSVIDPRIAPNGRWIVYGDQGSLVLRDLAQFDARQLPETQDASTPFWSPDSQWIGFARDGRLWKLPVAGGTPRILCSLPDDWSDVGGAAWGRDGRIVFTTGDTGLLSVSAQGGDPTPLLAPDEGEDDFHDVRRAPGDSVLFVVHADNEFGRIDALVEDRRVTIVEHPGEELYLPAFAPSGHVLYRRSGGSPGVWAIAVSTPDLTPRGEPFLVAAGGTRPSVADDGTLVYLRGSEARLAQLAIVDRQGVTQHLVGEPGAIGAWPSLAPDGRHVAAAVWEQEGNQIWVYDLERGTRTRVSSGEDPKYVPLWLPDGETLLYSSIGRGGNNYWSTPADGSREPEKVADQVAISLSADGRLVALEQWSGGAIRNIAIDWLDGSAERQSFLATEHNDGWPQFSPDGRYLAYHSDESGQFEVYIQPFPQGGRRWQVSTDGGTWPMWKADGSELFYARGDDILTVPVQAGEALTLGTPTILFSRSQSGTGMPFADWPECYDVTDDGQSFLVLQNATDTATERSLAVVQNWDVEFSELP